MSVRQYSTQRKKTVILENNNTTMSRAIHALIDAKVKIRVTLAEAKRNPRLVTGYCIFKTISPAVHCGKYRMKM
jgi:hypothetical protein